MRFQWAAMTLAGTAAASSNAQLESIWADAVARFAAEADELEFQMNAARIMASTRGRRGPG